MLGRQPDAALYEKMNKNRSFRADFLSERSG